VLEINSKSDTQTRQSWIEIEETAGNSDS